MIFKPSDFYTLQDNSKWLFTRGNVPLYMGQQCNSLNTNIPVNNQQLETKYFKELMESFPEFITVSKNNRPNFGFDFDCFLHINFTPTQDSEWQEIIFNNAQEILWGDKPNIFSSISRALYRIKEFKIIKKTTDSLLLCQFGKYEKFLIYTNSTLDECIKIYKINMANRDNRLFISSNEIPLLESEDPSI